MNRKTEAFKKENIIILIILLITFILTTMIYLFFSINTYQNANLSNTTATRIIDGDTFEIATGEIIRLLCINTPEKNKEGYEDAKQFLTNLILNKEITLKKGTQEKDNYGRLLRFAYINQETPECLKEENNDSNILSDKICITLGNNKILINKEIIKNGFGTLFEYNNEDCEIVK